MTLGAVDFKSIAGLTTDQGVFLQKMTPVHPLMRIQRPCPAAERTGFVQGRQHCGTDEFRFVRNAFQRFKHVTIGLESNHALFFHCHSPFPSGIGHASGVRCSVHRSAPVRDPHRGGGGTEGEWGSGPILY